MEVGSIVVQDSRTERDLRKMKKLFLFFLTNKNRIVSPILIPWVNAQPSAPLSLLLTNLKPAIQFQYNFIYFTEKLYKS